MSSIVDALDADVDHTFNRAANAQSKVGCQYPSTDYYEVGREKVREFARAVHDYHPVHWHEDAACKMGYSGLVAPATFLAVVAILVQRRLFEVEVTGYDLSQVMHIEQTYEYHRPVVVGDRVSSKVSLHSFRQAFGGDLFTTKTIVTDQAERPVVTTYSSLIARSGVVDDAVIEAMATVPMHGLGPGEAPITRPPAGIPASRVPVPSVPARGRNARTAASVSVGDRLAARTVRLTLGDLVNYAGASGDPNPIHWSTDVAALVGIDGGVVAHGQLTMALGAGYIVSWLGDPGAILSYGVRFTSPVYVSAGQPGEVEFTGKVKSIDEANKTAVVAITATHRGKKVFGKATATVQLS